MASLAQGGSPFTASKTENRLFQFRSQREYGLRSPPTQPRNGSTGPASFRHVWRREPCHSWIRSCSSVLGESGPGAVAPDLADACARLPAARNRASNHGRRWSGTRGMSGRCSYSWLHHRSHCSSTAAGVLASAGGGWHRPLLPMMEAQRNRKSCHSDQVIVSLPVCPLGSNRNG